MGRMATSIHAAKRTGKRARCGQAKTPRCLVTRVKPAKDAHPKVETWDMSFIRSLNLNVQLFTWDWIAKILRLILTNKWIYGSKICKPPGNPGKHESTFTILEFRRHFWRHFLSFSSIFQQMTPLITSKRWQEQGICYQDSTAAIIETKRTDFAPNRKQMFFFFLSQTQPTWTCPINRLPRTWPTTIT